MAHLASSLMCCLLMAQLDAPLNLLKRPEAVPDIPSPSQQSPDKIVQVLGRIAITSATAQAQAQRIQAAAPDLWGRGYLVGRSIGAPVNAELSVNEGSTSAGNLITFSTSYYNQQTQLSDLDAKRLYLFEYVLPDPDRPELRQLTAVHSPDEFLQKRQVKVLPSGMLSGDTLTGLIANGETRGRLARIERVGGATPHCLVRFESEVEADDQTQPVSFDITDEDLCNYALNLLALDQEVQMRFAQQVISEPTPYFVKSLHLPVAGSKGFLDSLTPAQRESLLKELEEELVPRLLKNETLRQGLEELRR